jgi:hypothetical protein
VMSLSSRPAARIIDAAVCRPSWSVIGPQRALAVRESVQQGGNLLLGGASGVASTAFERSGRAVGWLAAWLFGADVG